MKQKGGLTIISFTSIESTSIGIHSYECYDLRSDDDLISEVAEIVRDLYVEDAFLESALRNAAKGLNTVCDEAAIEQVISKVATAVIPQIDEESAIPLHLQVPRNEVAEVLALYVLEHIHGFDVPASRVKNKEVSGQPSRGLDVLGLTPNHSVAVTEVKASSSNSSPPPVVGATSDSMCRETLRRLNTPSSLIAEIYWALKHAKPGSKDSVAQTLLMYSLPGPPTATVTPVLVRPPGTYQDQDYGVFRTSPQQFGNSPVHFVVVRLQQSLEAFAKSVYARAAETPA